MTWFSGFIALGASASGFTEVSSPDYARAPVTFTGPIGSYAAPSGAIEYGPVRGSWGACNAVALFAAASGGTPLAWWPLEFTAAPVLGSVFTLSAPDALLSLGTGNSFAQGATIATTAAGLSVTASEALAYVGGSLTPVTGGGTLAAGIVTSIGGTLSSIPPGAGLVITAGTLAVDTTVLAPIAAPAFTGAASAQTLSVSGVLTAPTVATGDSSTNAATTGWVRAQSFVTTAALTAAGYVTASGASAAAPVQTVAGRAGNVVIGTGDIAGLASFAAASAPVQMVAGQTGTITGTQIATAIGLSSYVTTAALTAAGYVTASGAAAAAPVQSVVGITGTITAAQIQAAIGLSGYVTTSALTALAYVNASGASAAAPVQSVAGNTGTVTAAQIASAITLSAYAPLASPALTGTPTAPTPSAADSSTKLATTAWTIPAVATIAALRALAYAGLTNGQAVQVLAYATAGDGGAGLYIWNSSSTATDNSGIYVTPTGNSGSGRWVRQLPDGRVTPQMFGAKGDGSTNDTAAFNAAMASGYAVSVPAAVYVVANVTIPNGAYLEGTAGLGYSYDVTSSPNASQKLAVVRPILLAVSGTTSCILNVQGIKDITIKGLFLDGGANTPTCDGISSGSTQMLLERVTVTRCINGLGSVTNTDLYTHVAAIIYCEFCVNTNGISNLIDSNLFHTAVSANGVGVNLGAGANANTFLGGRYEWNTSCGMQGYSCASNMVIGGLFDRNSGAAVNLGTSCGDFTFNGVQFNRNGANNTYPGNAHIQLNGTTSVVFIGCVSQTGKNDDGSGNLTPAYFIELLNTNAYVVIEGCDCAGYVTGFQFGSNPTAFVQRDNIGAGTNYSNAQQPYMAGGRIAQTPYTKIASNITPGQSGTITMTQAPFTSNYSIFGRTLHVTAEDYNTPYEQQAASFRLMFNRGTVCAFNGASAAFGEVGGTGVINWGTAGTKINLAVNNVATDASTFNLVITNSQGTAAASNFGVWAELE